MSGEEGSSPLARGLLLDPPDPQNRSGIIPARAGFTSGPGGEAPHHADHPRSRGVYTAYVAYERMLAGSSPLARGLRRRPTDEARQGRIIPARAGFTPGRGDRPADTRDHPRSRGVYLALLRPVPGYVGIIPARAGFTSGRGGRMPFSLWIIPARAGFTRLPAPDPGGAADHPRSRGVYRCTRPAACLARGSSPLARGLPHAIRAWIAVTRIIPARAGFTR